MGRELDSLDRRLLDVLQRGIPLCAQPFAAVAQVLEITEQECLERIRVLREKGIIRRLGGVFNTRAMGFFSTLVAMAVAVADLDRVAGVVNEYPEVTHNYARQGHYNLWFTLVTEREEDALAIVEEIKACTGVKEAYLLPAGRVFKIQARFDLSSLGEQDAGEGAGHA